MEATLGALRRIPPAVWILATLVTVLAFYVGIRTGGFNMPLERIPWIILVPTAAAFSLGHSVLMLGWRRAFTLFAMATTISLAFEYYGEKTGLIFGPYHYTQVLGAKFGEHIPIPILIPLAWYMMFYPSYVIANLLGEGGPVSRRTQIVPIVWLALLSAMVMTAWDLTMDPVMSYHPCATPALECLSGELDQAEVGDPAWVWEEPGPHFGVPLLNFRGWLIASFTVFLLYRLVERRIPLDRAPGMNSRLMVSLPVGMYAGMALIDSWLGYPEIEDVHLISPFVMGIPAFFAAFQLFANRTDLPLLPVGGQARDSERRQGTGLRNRDGERAQGGAA